MKYIFIENGKLNGCGEIKQLTEGVLNFEVNDELYEDYKNNPLKYIFEDGQIILNPQFEELLAQEEREKLDGLSLTKREVFLALYKDKGITPEQLRAQLEDTEAQIEFDYANSYFRGNPLINLIGANLGYTSAQMDYLFKHGEFEKPNEDKKEKQG